MRGRRLRLESLEDRRVLAEFTVTSTDDLFVDSAADAPGTLRQAIFDANAVAGDDEIVFDLPFGSGPWTITLEHGEIAITDGLVVFGPGADLLTIDASGSDASAASGDGSRVFHIDDGTSNDVQVSLQELTITGGDTGILNSENGQGAGIFSREELQIYRSVVTGNATTSDGGGVASVEGYLNIISSEIRGNTAGRSGGGVFKQSGYVDVFEGEFANNQAGEKGGGIYIRDTISASIALSTITGNDAGFAGGGLYHGTGYSTLDLERSTISGNGSTYGGGIYNGTNATLNLTSSTISGNWASKHGGGLYNWFGNATISNSTVSGNDSEENGGGIITIEGQLFVEFSTITNNVANAVGTGTAEGGGIFHFGPVEAELYNSIVAGNSGGNGRHDLSGTFSALYSLIGDNTGAAIDSIEGNIIGTNESPVDPLLAPLADYGGTVATHRPLPYSPVFDAGDPFADAGVPPTPAFDGRGGFFTRVFDADGDMTPRIDIGAYEADEVYYTVDTLVDESDGDTSAGDFSLREAIEAANTLLFGKGVILFDSSIHGGTIELDSVLGQMYVTYSMEILGPGAGLLTIDASTADTTPGVLDGQGTRTFSLEGWPSDAIGVKISGLTITGGDTLGGGGAIHSGDEHLTLEDSVITGNSADWGGGLYSFNNGQLTVKNSEISGNTGTLSGGGIYNYGGRVLVEQSKIEGNSAPQGGGISNNDSPTGLGYLTVRQSTVSGNHVISKGGGILNEGISAVIEESTVSGNTAVDGAGIFNANAYIAAYDSVLEVIRSTITGNTASGYGGGVFDLDAVTYLRGSTIDNNSASYGGGVYAGNSYHVVISSTTISSNTASVGGGGIYNWDARMSISFSTITLNQADAGHGSGLFAAAGGLTEVETSIIAGNLDSDIDRDGFDAIASGGYNLVGFGNATDAFFSFDQVGVDPMLGPLADNGGPTMTHALLEGSPAIDGTAESDGDFDQRGEPFARVVDGDGDEVARADIGAFELQAPFTEPGGGVPAGDYNQDGSTDAADYVMWRKLLGTANGAPHETADGDGDLQVDSGDYVVWTEHFGETGPVEVGSGGGGVEVRIAETAGGQAVPDFATASVSIVASEFRHAQSGRRLVRGESDAGVQLRGDALVAWLSASDADRAGAEPDAGESAEQSTDERELSAENLDEFFAALAAS
jgi:CSLREA domain-containing protein